MSIRVVIRIYEMISMECTSKPRALAAVLEVSEHTLYNYIAFMKEELKAPKLLQSKRKLLLQRTTWFMFRGSK